MKLVKWEKDICKAIVKMYEAKEIELNSHDIGRWLEHEVSSIMDNMYGDHRQVVHDYLDLLIAKSA
jgi:hypothetical protein